MFLKNDFIAPGWFLEFFLEPKRFENDSNMMFKIDKNPSSILDGCRKILEIFFNIKFFFKKSKNIILVKFHDFLMKINEKQRKTLFSFIFIEFHQFSSKSWNIIIFRVQKIFSKIFFSTKNKKIRWDFFLKLMSCVRRIVLWRF